MRPRHFDTFLPPSKAPETPGHFRAWQGDLERAKESNPRHELGNLHRLKSVFTWRYPIGLTMPGVKGFGLFECIAHIT